MFVMFSRFFDLKHKTVFSSRPVLCVCSRKHTRSEESRLICSSTHAESHLNFTGSQCPATRNVSLSQQQPPWGQAYGGTLTADGAQRGAPVPTHLSAAESHVTGAR